MTYRGNVSEKISRLFNNTDLTLAFSVDNTLQHRLKHTIKTCDNKYSKSGVYKVICSTCGKYYIGQTGRSFQTRYREHTVGVASSKSVFGQHIIENRHCHGTIENNLKILHTAPKGLRLNLLEQIEIYVQHKKNPFQLLNEQIDFREKNYFDLFEEIL